MSWSGYSPGDLAAIAVGGVGGASLRWFVSRQSASSGGGWFEYAPNASVGATTGTLVELTFPSQTLLVNVLGCLLLGALTFLLTQSLPISRRLLIGAATGFCGSLTTFSTFTVEVAERLRGLPASTPSAAVDTLAYGPEVGLAGTYLAISLVGGGLAFWIGRALANRLVTAPGDLARGGGT